MIEDLGTDLRGELPKIKASALVLYEHDGTGKQPGGTGDYGATVKASYKGLANAKLVQVDESRHFIMYDQPAKLDAALEAFLR
jgi:pimeloyl-ACP methyl ester carboxylesterase